MNTHQLLTELRRQVAAGTVSAADLEEVAMSAPGSFSQKSPRISSPREARLFSRELPGADEHSTHTSSPSTFSAGALLLYAIGGLILLTGVLFLVGQVWDDVGGVGRVLLSLGLGLVTLTSGTYLYVQEVAQNQVNAQTSAIPTALLILGVLLTTPGVFVFLYELHSDVEHIWVPTIVFGMLALMYALLRYSMQHAVLTAAAVFHATGFFFCFVAALTTDVADTSTIYELLVVGTGIVYLALARYFGMHTRSALFSMHDSLLTQPLVSIGSLCVLGASFALMTTYSSLEIGYPLLVLALYYLGVVWESRIMLILGALFFLGHVSYITAQYFADSIGWPIALILLGIVFLCLGYVTLQMTKKFEE